ncbi:hypothetical protein BH09ACT1_BH09ACT1_04510 [soil metagenome]
MLLVGSLPRITLGVLSHELSLGGHLARRLARELGRPVELTITATESTIASIRPTLRGLRGVDVVLLALGDRELAERGRADAIQGDLELLLEQLASEPTAIETFVLSLPGAGHAPATQKIGRRDIRRSSEIIRFNSALEAVTLATGSATWVPFAPCPWADAARDGSRVRSSRTYNRWATLIAPSIVSVLAADSPRPAVNDLGFRPVVNLGRRPELAIAV